MGKIWICCGKTAGIPFFLEEQSLHLYSLEELCYYLYQNAEVIEESFFDEKLLEWLESELELTGLCEKLREGMAQEKSGFWCMGVILWESGYYTRQEVEKVRRMAEQMKQAKPEERKKLRADRMLGEKKYKRAVREYQQLLLQENPDRVLESRIWHNLGTAYARQFLFARASECYEKAYTMGHMEESRQQYLFASACAEDGKIGDAGTIPEDKSLQKIKSEQGLVRYEEELYQRMKQLAEEYIKSE